MRLPFDNAQRIADHSAWAASVGFQPRAPSPGKAVDLARRGPTGGVGIGDGLAGARIDRIAHAAHASKERLYAHFGDKAALFREVAARDGAEFFQTVALEPDDLPEFIGKLYDLARQRPDFLRMITWAHLERLTLDEPQAAGEPIPAQTLAAIEQAQQRNPCRSGMGPARAARHALRHRTFLGAMA
ncbi:TetR family transcriptional regulator [Nocardia salmonicida]|uniref:TetR family transcriptional regulator n=1 Tax=Nocardia salmonicida TaxID=53431 RepID=UPI002E2A54A9|nr:TetR family transcriptional regulator [Nocardia salmonicida]